MAQFIKVNRVLTHSTTIIKLNIDAIAHYGMYSSDRYVKITLTSSDKDGPNRISVTETIEELDNLIGALQK